MIGHVIVFVERSLPNIERGTNGNIEDLVIDGLFSKDIVELVHDWDNRANRRRPSGEEQSCFVKYLWLS